MRILDAFYLIGQSGPATRGQPTSAGLPWDHINVKKREYLEKEQYRSLVQLEMMAGAK